MNISIKKKQIYSILITSIIVLIGFFLRLYTINSKAIWADEAASLDFAKKSFTYLLTELSFDDPHSPFYYIVLKFWTSIFGYSEWSLRFPSLIFGMLCLPIIYFLAKELFNRRVGITALFISSINYYQIYFSQKARMYTMLLFFGILSVYLMVKFLKYRKNIILILYIISTTFVGYVHAHGIFIIIAENIIILSFLYLSRKDYKSKMNINNKEFFKKWIISQVIIFILLIPWLLVLIIRSLNQESPGWLNPPTYGSILNSYTSHFGFSLYNGGLLVLTLIGFFVLISLYTKLDASENESIIGFDKKYIFPTVLLFVLLIIPVIIPFIVSHLISPIYHPRYVSIISISAIILISKGIVTVIEYDNISIIIVAVLLITIIMPPVAYYDSPGRSEWDDTVDQIENNITDDDIAVSYPQYTKEPYMYYSENDKYERRFVYPSYNKTNISYIKTHNTIYLFSASWSDNQNLRLRSSIKKTHVRVRVYNYAQGHLEVYKKQEE